MNFGGKDQPGYSLGTFSAATSSLILDLLPQIRCYYVLIFLKFLKGEEPFPLFPTILPLLLLRISFEFESPCKLTPKVKYLLIAFHARFGFSDLSHLVSL